MKNLAKVFIMTMILSMSLAGTVLAKERLFTFSNNNDGAVKEVNYYLSHGAEVKYLHTAAKTTDSTVIITVVLDIPQEIPLYKK